MEFQDVSDTTLAEFLIIGVRQSHHPAVTLSALADRRVTKQLVDG